MIALLATWLIAGPAQAGCTLVRGATLHLPDGPVAGELRIAGQAIEAVGPGVGEQPASRDCAVIEAEGGHLTAGLIEVDSTLGLVEIGLEASTRDADPGVQEPIRAALQVAEAYNPRSSLIPVQRMGGVTGALVVPRGGRISGQAAYVALAGATQAEAVIAPSVAMMAHLGGSSRAQSLRELRQVLGDARDFRRLKAAWERGQVRPLAASGPDLEALWPVLDRTLPLVVGADRAADIEALIRFQEEWGIRLVIQGAAEGHLLAEALAAARIPVIVDPLVVGPGSMDQLHARADNAAILHTAGVPVILSTHSSHNARNLPQVAGNAVRGGMDPEAALAAITSVPAEVFGIEGRGRLEPGAVADVVLWTGDPLELRSWPQAVWIQGRPIPMESRQTRLRDAYAELPGTPRPALDLP